MEYEAPTSPVKWRPSDQEWEDFYNFNPPHGGLNGQTPYERLRAKTTENPPV